MQNVNEIDELIKIISKLPGLGPKSAKRIVLKLINNKIIKDIRGLSFPAFVFHKELDLKLISDELKAVPRKDLGKVFTSQRTNHPPRHDFNFYSFKDMKILDEDIDLKFFNELRRTGNF